MFVTVSICTRNRAASLARTLASIERSNHVACDWELLITDNGSTDGTADVVAAFKDRLPIRMQVESRPGVANARNASAIAASGHYMVCTDDDVVVDPNWFGAYLDSFRTWPSDDLFAGRIVPVLEPPVTDWFETIAPSVHALLAIRDMGDAAICLSTDGDHVPYGANCAVRTEVQRLFPFDTRRGPGATYFGEEITSFKAMMTAGHTGRWVPGSRVDHMISPKRQTLEYIRWWYEALGRTVVWEGAETHAGKRLFGAPRWLWRRAITGELAFRIAHMTSPPDIWIKKLVQVSLDRGRLRQFLSAPAPSL
jgi:hypothetical protein